MLLKYFFWVNLSPSVSETCFQILTISNQDETFQLLKFSRRRTFVPYNLLTYSESVFHYLTRKMTIVDGWGFSETPPTFGCFWAKIGLGVLVLKIGTFTCKIK